jgi:hypothetical protein
MEYLQIRIALSALYPESYISTVVSYFRAGPEGPELEG